MLLESECNKIGNRVNVKVYVRDTSCNGATLEEQKSHNI